MPIPPIEKSLETVALASSHKRLTVFSRPEDGLILVCTRLQPG